MSGLIGVGTCAFIRLLGAFSARARRRTDTATSAASSYRPTSPRRPSPLRGSATSRWRSSRAHRHDPRRGIDVLLIENVVAFAAAHRTRRAHGPRHVHAPVVSGRGWRAPNAMLQRFSASTWPMPCCNCARNPSYRRVSLLDRPDVVHRPSGNRRRDLGALDEDNELTPTGRSVSSHLPPAPEFSN